MKRMHLLSPLGWLALTVGTAGPLVFAPTGWQGLLACSLAMWTLLVCGMTMAWSEPPSRADLTVSAKRARVGDTVTLSLSIDGRRHHGSAPTQATLRLGSQSVPVSIPRLGAGQTHRIEMAVDTSTRGVVRVGPLLIVKGDPFGLVRKEYRLARRLEVRVHPRLTTLEQLRLDSMRDLDGEDSGFACDDGLELHGLRPYAHGDDIRRVHWRTSARTGSLMVRRFEEWRQENVALTLCDGREGFASSAEFELAAAAFASIGVHYLQFGHSLTVAVAGRRRQPTDVVTFLDDCAGIVPSSRTQRASSTAASRFRLLSRIPTRLRALLPTSIPALLRKPVATPASHAADAPHDASEKTSIRPPSFAPRTPAMHVVIAGSLTSETTLRQTTDATAGNMPVLVVRASLGQPPSVNRCGNRITLSIGTLEELPQAWKALA